MGSGAGEPAAGRDTQVEEYLEGAISLTLARNVSPETFLALAGAELIPGTQPCGVPALADEGTSDRVLIGVTSATGKPDWVLGAESPACVSYETVGELSVPDAAVSFHCTEDGGAWFTWAVGGDILVDFSLTDGDVISGSDPERLVNKMREAGLDPDDTTHPCATGALLMEMITGVTITSEILETAKFTSGSIAFPWF